MTPVVLGVLDFPGLPKAVAVARDYVADLAPDPAITEDLRLLTSEVVTNAIAHTASKNHLVTVAVLRLGGLIRVEVIDAGHAATVPHIVDDPDAVAGRGLLLVDQIAHRWGTWTEDSEHCVWFEVSTTQTRRALEVEGYASPHPSTTSAGGGSLKGMTSHPFGTKRRSHPASEPAYTIPRHLMPPCLPRSWTTTHTISPSGKVGEHGRGGSVEAAQLLGTPRRRRR